MLHLKRLSRRILDRLRRDETGQSLIIIAFAFIGLVAIVGLAIDLGLMYIERTNIGRAIDAAALAAAQELPNETAAWSRAEEYLRMNGYNLNDPDLTIVHSFPDEPVFDQHYQIAVTGTKAVPLTFLRVLGFTDVNIVVSAVGENANKLDIMLVLDRTGSMDDDTCYIYPERDPQYACNPWLQNITEIFSTNFDSGLSGWTEIGTPEVRDDEYSMDGNYVGLQGGWTTQEGIYREFDTTGYDVVKVTFWTRDIGMEDWGWGADELRLQWRVGSGGTISTQWHETPTSSWTQYQVELATGAAGIPDLQVRFRLSNTESGEYALLDDVTLVGANYGLGPCDGTGCSEIHGRRCTGGGSQDCGGSPDPFQRYFYEQPVYDTMVAADNFLDFLDSDLDQVGLASYNVSASVDIELTSDFDAITNTLYTAIDPDSCTNIGDGIYAGINGLSTFAPHNGRTNSVKVMILLSDGKANRPGSGPGCWENETAREHARAAARQARDEGIVIFAITQGEDVNRALMQEIAEEIGNGREYWAPTTEELDEVFAEIAQYIFLRLVR